MKSFKLYVMTPEKKFFEGDVEGLIVGTIAGRIEIMANHIAYATAVVPSSLRIREAGGYRDAFVSSGILEFSENTAHILVESAEWPENIDYERAEQSKERAEKRIRERDKNINIERARNSLMRANARLKLRDVL